MAKGFFTYKGRRYDFGKVSVDFIKTKKILPRIIAQEAVNFFKDRFREQGWKYTTLKSWKKRKSNPRKRTGRGTLIDSGKLRNAIHAEKETFKKVVIVNDMPYAAVHNEGFHGRVHVSAHTRSKSKMYKVKQTSLKTRKTTTRKQRLRTGSVNVSSFTRKMNIPQRQFMGNSEFLNLKIDREILRIIDRIFD